MSAFGLIMSASPPRADLPGDVAEGPFLTPAVRKRQKWSSACDNRIKNVDVAKQSCAGRLFRESILRLARFRKCFHTAKTQCGHSSD